MTDQVRIGDDGQLEIERTWDGEPLWSVETQQDELFAGDAFKQMPGQLPIDEAAEPNICMTYEEESAVDRFNAHWAQIGSPEAVAARAAERAEYEARYEAMRARKRGERS